MDNEGKRFNSSVERLLVEGVAHVVRLVEMNAACG